MRPVSSSTRTLGLEYLLPIRREEYQSEVSSCLPVNRSSCALAEFSLSPTAASGEIEKTTVGVTPRLSRGERMVAELVAHTGAPRSRVSNHLAASSGAAL